MKFVAFIESIIIAISCFFGSIFNLPDKNVQNLIEQNGGFIYGICHPNEDYDTLADAGLKWVRFDIPCPFDKNGNIRNDYLKFKERCKGYADHGFKVMAVTPYPRDIISDMGFNPVDDIERTKEIAVFLYNDLKDIAGGFQITNEMGLVGFMHPLTIEEAAFYIGSQLEAITEEKAKNNESFPIGYNSADLIQVSRELHKLMKPYLKYCDYVGIDLYTGNQGDAEPKDYAKKVKKLYRLTGKPIIIEEFGFWSAGGKKSAEEKAEILGIYGYSTETEAIADGENFINKLPWQFRNTLSLEHPDEKAQWAELVFSSYSNHFYGETSEKTINNIPHTPDGQAEYYKAVMTELKKLNCLAGMIIYCNQDMAACFACGHSWCPFETKWGICTIDGTPKPAYYAVKEVITGTK
ncbi:MAG: hypothetical protein MJ147_04330 [Clostridia bacterium]|nr:hypothetical protein [Clostridia bacterium]